MDGYLLGPDESAPVLLRSAVLDELRGRGKIRSRRGVSAVQLFDPAGRRILGRRCGYDQLRNLAAKTNGCLL